MVLLEVLSSLLDPCTLLVLLTSFLVARYLFTRTRHKLPPEPPAWPILGHIPFAIKSGRQMYKVFIATRKAVGDIAMLRMGPIANLIVISGYRNIHKAGILMDDKFKFRPAQFPIVRELFRSKGVIFSNGDVNKALRRFTLGAMRDFGVGKRGLEEKVQEEAEMLTVELKKYNGEPQVFTGIYRRAVSNVIASVVYGFRYDYSDNEHTKMMQNVDFLFRNVTPFLPENAFPFLMHLPGSKFNQIKACMKELEKNAKKQISEHRNTFDPENIRDFVDLYLKHEGSGEPYLTEENLFRVIVDLNNAGTDTTANTLTWTILFLAKYPKVQTKLRRQINDVVGSGMVSMSDKGKLPYLQAVINEVLRLGTIAPSTVPRCVVEDTEFEGYTIPKDTVVLFNLYSILMDPETWKDPEEFRPERFLNEKGELIATIDQFIPFGLGSRSCIGKFLALMEAFLFVGYLVPRLEFKFPSGIPEPSTARVQTGVTCCPEVYKVRALPIEK